MIASCPNCNARTEVIEVGSKAYEDYEGESERVVLVACKHCDRPLVLHQVLEYSSEGPPEWETLRRLWPFPEGESFDLVPQDVKQSLSEARMTLAAGAPMATSVMCGRALEGICRHFLGENVSLRDGISKLHANGTIDGRLIEWAEALHLERNSAAHSCGSSVDARDARDLVNFVEAICEYVFALPAKFEAFKKRRAVFGNSLPRG